MAKTTKKATTRRGGKKTATARASIRDDKSVGLAARACVAALKRAISVVESQIDEDTPKLAPGSYPIALEFGITGDVVIGQPKVTKAKEEPDFDSDELLAALLVDESPDRIRVRVRDAVYKIFNARKDGDIRAGLAGAASIIDEAITNEAKARGLWLKTPEKTGDGATSGTPNVEVLGTVGINEADVEVALDA